MITISTSELQEHLKRYLDQVAKGETVVIREDQREVARLVPAQESDWRDRMTVRLEFNVPPEQLVEPLDDIWEDYT